MAMVLTVLLLHTTAVYAQDVTPTPDPTPTSTPAYVREVILDSDASMIIDRSVSYGDIAVVIAVSGMIMVQVITTLVTVTQRWMR